VVIDFDKLREHGRKEHAEPDPKCGACGVEERKASFRNASTSAQIGQPPIPAGDHPQFQYVAGPAGSGKSFMMKERLLHGRGQYTLCATTGIAAINVGGTTINSALQFYDTSGPRGSLKEAFDKGWLHSRLRKHAEKGRKRWIIDEVSMMDGRQLDILTQAMIEVNEASFYRHAPADQLGLTLCGDFAQLPPVNAPFAFETESWKRLFEGNTLTLTHIHRQADPEFIAALREARIGHGTKALDYFRGLMHDRVDPEFPGPTIVATNAEVDRINQAKLKELPGQAGLFVNEREGKQRGEWSQVPETLQLRAGALVMVLANARDPETKDYLYVNGDLGEYLGTDIGEDTQDLGSQVPVALVRLQRNGEVVGVSRVERAYYMRKGDPGAVPLHPELALPGLDNLTPGATGDIDTSPPLDEDGEPIKRDPDAVLVGFLNYMPLRLAYATTVHKSQGLSLDKVQVNIKEPFFGNPGSLYVALSRARSPAGLRLVGSPALFVARCKADERVRRFL